VGEAVFVDSGAWIALLHRADRHHGTADRLFRLAAERRTSLLVTNLVVAEVHRLVLHRVGIRASTAFLDRLDASSLLRIEFASRAHHRRAREWLRRLGDQAITYADAVSFAVMEAMRCRRALSFDHDFVVAGFDVWTGH
jgi:predicted nucleic acid-binding protein